MNSHWTTAIHLARTEILRNLWLIIILWVLPVVLEFPSLTVLIAGVLAARFALELHPTRATANWRTRPATVRHWFTTMLILTTVVFVLPAVMHQIFAGWRIGFDSSALFWSAIEIAFKTMILVSATVAFAVVAGSAPRTLALIVAALLTSILIVYISDTAFDLGTQHNWRSPDQFPSTIVWWLTWPSILAVILIIIAYFATKQHRRAAIVLLFVSLPLGLINFQLAHDNSSSARRVSAPASIKLSEDPPSAATPIDQSEQRLRSNVAITGLPNGAFVEIRQWNLQGVSTNEKQQWTVFSHTGYDRLTSDFARQALWDLLDADHQVIGHSFNPAWKPEHGAAFVDPEKPIRRRDNTGLPPELTIGGYAFRWSELGEMPITAGKKRMRHDVFAQLRKVPIDGWTASRAGTTSYSLQLFWPNLNLSPSATEYSFADEYLKTERLAVVAHHQELKESVMLFFRSERQVLNSDIGSANPFGLQRTERFSLKIYANPNWRILYPEGDVIEQWLNGATLKIFVPDYLGQFNDSLTLHSATVNP